MASISEIQEMYEVTDVLIVDMDKMHILAEYDFMAQSIYMDSNSQFKSVHCDQYDQGFKSSTENAFIADKKVKVSERHSDAA